MKWAEWIPDVLNKRTLLGSLIITPIIIGSVYLWLVRGVAISLDLMALSSVLLCF